MSKFLMAGLPGSGKTTYLAALFHLLRMQAPNVAGLALAELPVGHEYLMELESAWLRFEPFERTVPEVPGTLVVPFERHGQTSELSIPDLRGEDFESVWEYGVPSDALHEVLADATGVLLFIRADDVQEPEAQSLEVKEIASGETFELRDWDAASAPTQTKLCDILEVLGLLSTPKPVAVVVSAWDAVAVTDTPQRWLQRRVPLVFQVLDSNGVLYDTFGISAQGGDLKSEANVAKMSQIDPVARIAGKQSRIGDDLTAPLAWLLEA